MACANRPPTLPKLKGDANEPEHPSRNIAELIFLVPPWWVDLSAGQRRRLDASQEAEVSRPFWPTDTVGWVAGSILTGLLILVVTFV